MSRRDDPQRVVNTLLTTQLPCGAPLLDLDRLLNRRTDDGDEITLQQVELGVLGTLQVRQYGLPVAIPGAKPRAILTMLGLHGGSVVSADTLVELLWGDDPPRTAAKALQTHISALRRTMGEGFVLTQGTGWTLSTTEIDASRYKLAAKLGRDAIAAGDASQAVARFNEALHLWRGVPELPDGRRGVAEKTRWIEGHAALVEDRADALLATGRAAEIIGELEAAIADAPLRERRWGHLMLALYRAGRQGEALGAYQRARSLLAEELGVDPGPDIRRLEAAIVAQDVALELPVSHQLSAVTRAVTFLLTDIEGSTAAWEADADAMAVALARHDEIVEQVVTFRGGRLIKTRGEGDATFSVFDRPSAAAAAAIELQEAIRHEPWALTEPMRIRVALHTGEVEFRDGDYFGRAVNRAARLRSLATGGQILCSGATAELVIDSLSDDVVLADLGTRQLRNLARPEHVFELRLDTADDSRPPTPDAPMERPDLPAVLAGPGPFVGRRPELERLLSAWQTTLDAGTHAVLIAGEPGVGKTRLAGEWSRQAYELGAVVLYGRCDEDLGAPYQPFAEALRTLVPCLGTDRLRGLRGVEALLPLVPGLTDVLPDLAAPPRADADTERYALFDAVVALVGIAATSAPIVLILDDLHWAAKPTLLLLRHILRFGEHARVQIVGTYRSTDLDRAHPLAAMLADLHRDGSADRLALSGLDEDDVTAYVAEAGYDDEELARALASVTGGNPFFLIEALRHVDESGGRWDSSTLPQGVREAVSRRLSRLPAETNKALAAAAVVGSRFALDLVERVVDGDLVDAFDEACKAGIVIEEPGGRYRFNHAIVRQSLLAELASVRRMRLHQRIAATLETEPGAKDELLAELAYHYFECAWAGNAGKAVEYCRRAADQAMARLAYEGAADLYDKALHALEELDEELPDREDQQAELLVARCEALLAAGDVVSAAGAVSQLQDAAGDSARLTAWGTCFDGQLSMLTHPERLDEIESALSAAAEKLAALDDAAGEAKAHTVRAGCLARLGRIGAAETALDQALTAARRAREHRRVNAVLANAPLAALWGPNPVPRAGGRCLDVVRLLRITTGSPVVEATSTRCQGVLDAFRGRAAAGRQLIDSARRSLTELGMRHALLEVDQFAGIVELVADDPASAEPHLRRAYNGFRRMGLDADTAETAALLARACLALDSDAEADELCVESERLAGHALKASIAWRTVRAQLLARRGAHDQARRVAEEAVAVAERTDLLVDHGDACLTLATVLDTAGDITGARTAAEKAVALYELKGAAALAEKARHVLSAKPSNIPAAAKPPSVELDNGCVRVIRTLEAAFDREAWGEVEQLYAPDVFIESRRKVVGFNQFDLPSGEWPHQLRQLIEMGWVRHRNDVVAVRGERLALTRLELGTADVSPGAPQVEVLQLFGLDDAGRIALQVSYDVEDIDAAMAELNAAHARFEERPQLRRLENTASQVFGRLNADFSSGDWAAMANALAQNMVDDDRRRTVNAGIRRGRDVQIANGQAVAETGAEKLTSTVIATRGERLALCRSTLYGRDQQPGAFRIEFLSVVEIDADEQLAAHVAFDLDDVDAAFEELDARYLAGEAAPYAQSWHTLVDTLGELNRHEIGPTLEGLAYTDHRRIPFAPGDFERAIEDLWVLVPDARYRATEVHALDSHGAVITLVIEGTDTDGNELQWARILSWVFEAARVDVYEDDDLDAALAQFKQPRPHDRELDNTASRTNERFLAHFAVRDWDAIGEMLADDHYTDDRRRVIGAGVRHGRDAGIDDMRAVTAEFGTMNMTAIVIATRGDRLALSRARYSGQDRRPGAFRIDVLHIIEIDADERIAAFVMFDPDDVDAAFEELDARFVAGEAAPYSDTWSVIAESYAAIRRHELPPITSDCVTIDHRRAMSFAPGDLIAYIRAGRELGEEFQPRIEIVHRLTNRGAVITYAARGRSPEGFEAEWREISMSTVDGGLVNRCEIFDETDIDSAIARFEQLSRLAPRPENAASQVCERFRASFAARDWDAMANMVADDLYNEDRRRAVNAGIRHGRDSMLADMRAAADIGVTHLTAVEIATRGERLVLVRGDARTDEQPGAFHTDVLQIAEIGADERIAALVMFDLDDIDAAFEELDARYLAGEAAAHAHTWSVITQGYFAANRGEFAATAPDVVNVDHRQLGMIESGELIPYLRDTFDELANISTYLEAVHLLTDLGAVVTHVGAGTSKEGFDAEWRMINIIVVGGDLISRTEVFDEADIDAALARFDELSRPAPRLENAASQTYERSNAYFVAREWDELSAMLADDIISDDRRRVVRAGAQHGRETVIETVRAIANLGMTNLTTTIIATRGRNLVLSRARYTGRDQAPEAFRTDILQIVEIDADNRMVASIVFDPDDLDAAFAELDARYLAGEAAAHAHTWSVLKRAKATLNQRQPPATTPDHSLVDHRPLAVLEAIDLTAYLDAGWVLTPGARMDITAVHRLTNLGTVVTWGAHATSQQGFDAEWRTVSVVTIEGDLINRAELFDESDIDAALARFDELSRPAPRLENAASGVDERFQACFAARDWAAMGEILADEFSAEDRRRVVNSGIRRGRDAKIADMRATADLGTKNATSTVIAIRGQRLALVRIRLSGRDQRPDAFHTEMLGITEINADSRMAARVLFDVDDFDAAFEELDARYIAGEAATHAHTWSIVTDAFATLNRHELPTTTPAYTVVDHQLHNEASGLTGYLTASWELTPDFRMHIEAVHRLTELGAVVTLVVHGTSQEGFKAEWRLVEILTEQRCEIFDETDIDAALARFDELSSPAPRLENAASHVDERFGACFAARDWDGAAEMLADDTSTEDRRRAVNSGIRHGRDAVIASMRAIADVGVPDGTSVVIATRGDRLALSRIHMSSNDQGPESFHIEMLGIVEIDADERIAARVTFDVDDIDAAFAELEARYLAGEAAGHAHTWSVIADGYAAFNRRELPPTTPDWVNVDHRRVTTIAPGELFANVRVSWDIAPDIHNRVEIVHRLSRLGAVVTRVSEGTSQEGFNAEWRSINVVTVDGDLISRLELFDEADLDAALAAFEQLHVPTRQLENAASQAHQRFYSSFAARDWTALREMLAVDTSHEDRRRVVSAGIRRGHDAEIESMRATANIGVKNATVTVIATRGQRLALSHLRFSGRNDGPEAFHAELLGIVEIDAGERIAARISFDLDDIDAAFDELDARYLAGEAAPHAHTWSVISRAYAALNRREMYPTTTEFVNIDHRRGAAAFSPGDLIAYMHAAWNQIPDLTLRIEAVHRLTNLGAVYTQVLKGASEEGFAAEWRIVEIMMVERTLVSRAEIFDEADLDAALAKFDELNRPGPRLENAASRADDRLKASFAARDWAAIEEILPEDASNDDRRRVVGAGVLHGRKANIADLQAIADVGTKLVTSTAIATRQERLVLSRYRFSGLDPRPEAFHAEMLGVVEINADNRITARVWFDLEDIDAAFEELDARYLAGEAAAHARTWSVIAGAYAALNRREIPATTPDWVNVDHRRIATAEAGDLAAFLRATWDLMPHASGHIVAVHRLSNLGAVVTQASHGESPEGFDAEWREISMSMVDGDLISRCELFDEEDLDAALARFDELNRQAPQLENAASRGYELLRTYFAARDWGSMAEMMADDVVNDDRRRVVNAGIRHGKDAFITLAQATADVGATNISASAIATRGSRLALTRTRTSNAAEGSDGFYTEGLDIVEIDVDERFVARVAFDLDDIDAAYAELENRYLAGEAAAHVRTWSVIVGGYAAVSRHEMPPSTPDWVNVDHRRGSSFAPGEMDAYMHAAWELTPDIRYRIEAVHRLSDLGAVVTHVSNGTTQAGFDAEWRVVNLLTVEGDLFSRCEMFDEADIDAAFARFDELNRQAPQLENAAIRAQGRVVDAFNRHDMDSFLAIHDARYEDRRRVMRYEGTVDAKFARAMLFEVPESWQMESEPIATRGHRRGLNRVRWRDTNEADRPIAVELLNLIEVNDDELISYVVFFDPDDINGATGELTARWIASGEVAHPEVIEAARYSNEAYNLHDWDAIAKIEAGAAYVNHRQLASAEPETIADHWVSIRTLASLIPDMWIEPAEVFAHSANGMVSNVVVKGTTSEGTAIELPAVILILFEGSHVTRMEAFDPDQRDLALARFEELNRPG